MAPHSSTLAWKIPWMEESGGLQSMRVGHDWATSLSLFTFHFPALEKEMATHSSILAWRIPGTEEPGGLPSMGSRRVGHNWRDLAAAAAATPYRYTHVVINGKISFFFMAKEYFIVYTKHIFFIHLLMCSWVASICWLMKWCHNEHWSAYIFLN